VIARRLAGAAREIRDYEQYDYILVNEDVEAASRELQAVVAAERIRRGNPGVKDRVRRILASFETEVEPGPEEVEK
jgi:guanylate kinase